MRIDAIPIGKNPPHDINVIIEVPIGGEPIKYEMDKASGALFVDRFLYTPMRYPGNYGFIPHTLSRRRRPDRRAGRQHPRDRARRGHERAAPVGVLVMEDEAGGDEKIIAVPSPKLTQRYDNDRRTTTTCRRSPCKQIEHFFEHYKDLEPGKWVKIIRWGDAAEARKLIVEAIERAA